MSGTLDPGFTPAPDCIRDDIDALAALVFGAVWRWCQMDRGQCEATVEAIAKRAGCSTTAARVRLRALERHGWLAAEMRQTKTTIYRDAGRWQLRAVGVDTKPTRDVAQREALATSQRETLAKPTRDVAPLKESLEERKEVGDVSPSTGSDRWETFYAPVATDLTGRSTGWRNTRAKSEGAPLAVYGQLARIFGAATGNDPARAIELWQAFVAEKKAAKFRDSGESVWRGISTRNVVEMAGRWIKDRGATIRDVVIVAPMVVPRG